MDESVKKYGVTVELFLTQTEIIPNENLKLENFH